MPRSSDRSGNSDTRWPDSPDFLARVLRTPTATLSLADASLKAIAVAPEDIPARWWKPQPPKLDQDGLTKAIRARDKALKEAEAIPDPEQRGRALEVRFRSLAPDALLPGSGSAFDLWREDEDRRRVKTIVGAFAERPKLPKMLRRKDLLDTVANGCEQGLFVLSLPRPDGSTRTWWRRRIEEAALSDDALEAVQNAAAVLDGLAPDLLVPGKLDGLDWKNGVKVADLVSYFDGYVLTIDHPDEGWTEQRAIPRCLEAKILEAGAAAVKSGAVWLTSGTASIWGDAPPSGIVSKTAVLRVPPQPIDVSSMTPEALPDAWSGNRATAHSIEQAVAAQRGVASLPWKLVETAITAAMNSGFLRLIPGGVAWPCQAHEAGAVEFDVPEAATAQNSSGGRKTLGMAEATPAAPWSKTRFREAILDSSEMIELVEAMGDVLAAAGNLTLRFRVSVEFADGENPTPDVTAKLTAALAKAAKPFE